MILSAGSLSTDKCVTSVTSSDKGISESGYASKDEGESQYATKITSISPSINKHTL